MRVSYFPYSLFPLSSIGNVATGHPRLGSLLRFEFSDGRVGYADCHPWPELGDSPLENQLLGLSHGKLSYLTQRSISYAKIDAFARAEKKSCWEDLSIPESHFLVPNIEKLQMSDLEAIRKQGFTKIKIKLGKKFKEEAALVRGLSSSLRSSGLQIRFDFNSSLTLNEVQEFLETLGSAKDQIDLIEDPTPYDAKTWEKIQNDWGVRLALDRILNENVNELVPGSITTLVIKPAIQDPEKMIDLARQLRCSVFVTSYLDHPLGQLCAAWVAAQLRQDLKLGKQDVLVETCGLLSQSAYRSHCFAHHLETQGPYLKVPLGTGFGFDSLLDEINWSPLGEKMNESELGV